MFLVNSRRINYNSKFKSLEYLKHCFNGITLFLFVEETSIHPTKPILNSTQTLPASSLFGCVPVEVGNIGMHLVCNAILGIF